MFGRFAQQSLSFLFAAFFCVIAHTAGTVSPKLNPAQWQQAQVVPAGGTVYKAPDFDSPLLGHVKA